jgi:molecular chaperone DnaK (HSP70)
MEEAVGTAESSGLHPDLAVAEGAAILAYQLTTANKARFAKQYPSFALTVSTWVGQIHVWLHVRTYGWTDGCDMVGG